MVFIGIPIPWSDGILNKNKILVGYPTARVRDIDLMGPTSGPDLCYQLIVPALRTGSIISETILCRPIHKIEWNYRHSRFDYC